MDRAILIAVAIVLAVAVVIGLGLFKYPWYQPIVNVYVTVNEPTTTLTVTSTVTLTVTSTTTTTLTITPTTTLQILDYRLYANSTIGNLLGLEVENPTGTTFVIVSVSVGGQSCTYQSSGSNPPTNATLPVSAGINANGIVPGTNGAVSVEPGASAWLYYSCGSPGSLQAGIQYDGTVVLSTGAILRFTIIAQPG